MTHPRFLQTLSVCFALIGSSTAAQAQWTARFMTLPPGTKFPALGYYHSGSPGAAAGSVSIGISAVGAAYFKPSFTSPLNYARAVFWNSTSAAAISLHPAGFTESYGIGNSGGQQVGYGSVNSTYHALLWSGSAASAIDLHPGGGWTHSEANGTNGSVQVGFCYGSGLSPHAFLWEGSAVSAIDLHPPSYVASYAIGVDGANQVGVGDDGTNRHALMWSGTAASVVDLNPPGFANSQANAISSGQIVGYGNLPSGANHALRWSGGTAASAIDLNPVGFVESTATACATYTVLGFGTPFQVGYGRTAYNGPSRALVWGGSAYSAVDLHAVLASLGSFRESWAFGISLDAREIVGSARGANGVVYAVAWRR